MPDGRATVTTTDDLGPALRAGATDAAAVSQTSRASWVHILIDWIERAPGPTWVTYLVLTGAAIAVSNAQAWVSGIITAGEFDVALSYYGFLMVAPLWFIHGLDRLARRSLDAFRPALDVDDEAFERFRSELSDIPARPAALLAIAGFAITIMGLLADPVGMDVDELSGPGLVLRVAAESLVGAFILVLLYHTLRQLRTVSRIHALASRIDLLRPAPLYAFSRLTSATAIGIVLILYLSVLVDPGQWQEANIALMLPWIVGPGLIALAAFVLPLRGMHDRIAAEKRRLQDDCARRIQGVTASVHAAVDADDLSRADGLNKMLASLTMEREMLARLPTWPWQPGTVGAFATAVVLPVGLFLVTRLLERSI